MRIAIARPLIGEEEKRAACQVLDSGHLSRGAKVAELEQAFAAYHGAKLGVATSNGTTALMAMMMAHGLGPGDEVIVPSFSFFATAASVLSVGATPVFADIDRDTFCLSPAAAEAAITPRTKAIMPVHLYGQPADMPRFEVICRDHGLILLEDAAQAHGAAIASSNQRAVENLSGTPGVRHVGTFGTAAFSFHPTKNMTTTEGGMVLTNDDDIARKLRMICNQGRSATGAHEIVGYNFRMTEVAAAIGVVQLGRLRGFTAARSENAAYFDDRLEQLDLPRVRPGRTHVYHQYTVRVRAGTDRDGLVQRLSEMGIEARVYYATPIHEQPAFRTRPEYRDLCLPETERAAREVLSLPVHPALTEPERAYIVDQVNAAC